jgi:hypothetical protein
VWAALLTGGLALLSLGPHLHVAGTTTAIPLPWLVLAHLPLFESADADRAMLLGFLPLALVVARWADSAWPARRAALVAVLLFAVAAVLPPVPYVWTAVEVPAFFQAGGGVERLPRDAIVLVTPFSSKESSEAMLWQATAGYRFRMPEGDAFTPGPTLGPKPSFLRSTLEGLDAGTVAASPSPEARDRMLAELHELGVTAVVAGPSPGSDRIVAYLITVLGEPPESREGVRVWWRCCPAPG